MLGVAYGGRTMTPAVMIFEWDGDGMVPLPRFRRLADKHFVVHENYRLEVREDRSAASHNHYFAALHEAWQNLPEDLAEKFPTPEHLRKHALIRAGYRDERTLVAASKAEAQRLAAFVKPMDEYAVVLVDGATVTVYTAQSQSFRAMGKKRFSESKEAVLGIIAGLVGVDKAALVNNAGRAA